MGSRRLRGHQLGEAPAGSGEGAAWDDSAPRAKRGTGKHGRGRSPHARDHRRHSSTSFSAPGVSSSPARQRSNRPPLDVVQDGRRARAGFPSRSSGGRGSEPRRRGAEDLQLGAEGNFVGGPSSKSEDPARRARAESWRPPPTSRIPEARTQACEELWRWIAPARDRGPGGRRRLSCRGAAVEAQCIGVPGRSQGDLHAHRRRLRSLGAEGKRGPRTPHQLDRLDGLVIPGGDDESDGRFDGGWRGGASERAIPEFHESAARSWGWLWGGGSLRPRYPSRSRTTSAACNEPPSAASAQLSA